MLEEFQQLIAQSSFLTTMVNNCHDIDPPAGTESAIGYLWDGYIDCAIVFDGEKYHDVQDINLGEGIPAGWRERRYGHYADIHQIVAKMERVGQ